MDMEEQTKIGYAWYRRKQWALLRSAAADSDELEDHYDDWLKFAEPAFQKRKAQGLNIHKVDIDVEELIRWCQERAVPLNGAARAEFAARKLKEQDKG